MKLFSNMSNVVKLDNIFGLVVVVVLLIVQI